MYIFFFFQVIKNEVLKGLITNKSNKGFFASFTPLGAVLIFFEKMSWIVSPSTSFKIHIHSYKRIRK